MKILKINFYKLRNEEWFQLFTEFRDLVLKFNPDALNIRELWATFLILYADIFIFKNLKSSTKVKGTVRAAKVGFLCGSKMLVCKAQMKSYICLGGDFIYFLKNHNKTINMF